MTRWISHDLYAHIPECDGYLPLSIAFAQFAAVKCDVDPFNHSELGELLRESSDAQELLRWFARLLQSGKLRSVSRPLGGGPVTKMNNNHWHADDLVQRFLSSTYCRADPFAGEAAADSWIFVDETDYLKLWEEHREAVVGRIAKSRPPKPAPSRDRRPDLVDFGENLMLGLSAVEDAVGLRRSTIYKMIDEGRFPEQVKIGNRSLWRRAEIIQWVEQLGHSNSTQSDVAR